MERIEIRKKIQKYEKRRDDFLEAGMPISAQMEDNVVKALTRKLEEKIGGSPIDHE